MTTTTRDTADLVHPATSLLRLAVIAGDGVWMQPRIRNGQAISAACARTPAQTLNMVLARMERENVAQVWAHPAHPMRPDDASLSDAQAEGWTITVADALAGHERGAWVSAYRSGVYARREVYFPALDVNSPFHAPAIDSALMARALARYTLATGAFWFRSPGATGHQLMERAMRRHRYELTPTAIPIEMRDLRRHRDGALVWMRPPNPREMGARYLVSVDRNAAWLAAAGMASLGVGAPVYAAGDEAQKVARIAKAGLFRLRDYTGALALTACGLPDPIAPPTGSAWRDAIWVSRPTLDYLDELGVAYDVAECYAQQVAHRALEGWYERLRQARTDLLDEPTALDLLKSVYTQALGWLAAEGIDGWDRSADALYRPDWYATIKALARMGMLRAGQRMLNASGATPLLAHTDAWYYLCDDPDALTEARGGPKNKLIYPLGRGMAEWKRASYDLSAYPDLRVLLAERKLGALLERLNEIDDELDGLDGEAGHGW